MRLFVTPIKICAKINFVFSTLYLYRPTFDGNKNNCKYNKLFSVWELRSSSLAILGPATFRRCSILAIFYRILNVNLHTYAVSCLVPYSVYNDRDIVLVYQRRCWEIKVFLSHSVK
jgi:hypothetical protein